MKKRTNLTLSPFVLLTAMLCMTSYAPAQRTASVTVDAGTTYQHIDGFGGVGMSGQWAASYTQDKVDKLWGADGMGYNIMRIRIAPNENDWAAYVPTVKWGRRTASPFLHLPGHHPTGSRSVPNKPGDNPPTTDTSTPTASRRMPNGWNSSDNIWNARMPP